jgi:hypothetical protein
VKNMNLPQQIKDIKLPDLPQAIKDLKFWPNHNLDANVLTKFCADSSYLPISSNPDFYQGDYIGFDTATATSENASKRSKSKAK